MQSQESGGGPASGAGAYAPDFSAWGLDGATAQLGMQLGHSAVAAGQDYVQKNVCISTFFPSHSLKMTFLIPVRHTHTYREHQTSL